MSVPPGALSEALDKLAEEIGPRLLRRDSLRGEVTVVVSTDAWFEACQRLKNNLELAFDMLTDLTVVDLAPLEKSPRFELVAHLYSIQRNHRVRLKASLSGKKPEVASLTSLWKNANWLEREAWDMFGVRFGGHPDLKRILLYPEFKGHALRKDYPLRKRQPLVTERDVDEPDSMSSEPIRYPAEPRFKSFGV
ncbi:MAG: NADH-quinone oxidoreductase subunit C [Vicinamibacteria bacterium]